MASFFNTKLKKKKKLQLYKENRNSAKMKKMITLSEAVPSKFVVVTGKLDSHCFSTAVGSMISEGKYID